MLKALNYIVILVGLSGCHRAVFTQNPLVYQILKPRPEYPGMLTNRACLKYDGEKCIEEDVDIYDMNDEAFREKANTLDFICNIGGRRFKICKDKPGFCRRTFKKKCWWKFCRKRKLRNEEYIPVEPYQFLLDANVKCFNKDRYPFE